MLVKDTTVTAQRPFGTALLLAAGAALGFVLAVAVSRPGVPAKEASAPVPADVTPAPLPVPTAAGPANLPRLELTIAPDDWSVLAAARERALAEGVLRTSDDSEVPAEVRLGDETAKARVRLKGDLLDHVDTDRWSMRIELRGGAALGGMSRFAIQHPKTRGVVLEWLLMQAAHDEGLITPRVRYVRVAINGAERGIYYLEEQFSKELIEANGRRDSAVVRFREDALWDAWWRFDFFGGHKVPRAANAAETDLVAELDAFDERRLEKDASLEQRLRSALQEARDLQRRAAAAHDDPELRRLALDALVALQGRTLDQMLAIEPFGRLMALYSLFRAHHGLSWNQHRYYHDPLTDRLEMVPYDSGANPFAGDADVAVLEPVLRGLRTSDRAYEATFVALGRITDPSWLEGLLERHGERLAALHQALVADGSWPDAVSIETIVTALQRSAARLRAIVTPDEPAGFWARQVEDHGERQVEIEAWAVTEVPVVIEGFRLSNGRVVSAASAVDAAHRDRIRDGGAVVLPQQHRRLVFRFPADVRLSGLRDVQALKQAIRAGAGQASKGKLEIHVRLRSIAVPQTQERLLPLLPPPADPTVGRPPAPTLEECLRAHPFLSYDVDRAQVTLRGGTWDVEGDLVLPDRMSLHASEPAMLRFEPGAVLLATAALQLDPDEGGEILLQPQDDARGWGGVVVLGAEQRSRLHHVRIRGTTSPSRGGWQVTGGVTFSRSAVQLDGCTIADARGEDALNVVAAEVILTDCDFDGGASDLFDGDFVHGTVRGCRFARSGEDGVDVSGSRITVVDDHFEAIGDKAVSVGEGSEVTVQGGTVVDASIAVAAKDRSHAEVRELTIHHCEHYAFAVYIKKSEFGAATMTVAKTPVGDTGFGLCVVQTGCTLDIDDEAMPTVDLDVDELYREGVLGK